MSWTKFKFIEIYDRKDKNVYSRKGFNQNTNNL